MLADNSDEDNPKLVSESNSENNATFTPAKPISHEEVKPIFCQQKTGVELPAEKRLKKEVKQMTKDLDRLQEEIRIEDAYTGTLKKVGCGIGFMTFITICLTGLLAYYLIQMAQSDMEGNGLRAQSLLEKFLTAKEAHRQQHENVSKTIAGE